MREVLLFDVLFFEWTPGRVLLFVLIAPAPDNFAILFLFGEFFYSGNTETTQCDNYKRVIDENLSFPDLIIIDGGKGQYSVSREVLNELGLHDLPILAVAKGKKRNAGEEKIYYESKEYILEKLVKLVKINFNLIGKKRILIPFPLALAKISARLFEFMPKPLLTRDQLILLKYDNIPSGKYKTNSDIGVPSKRYFDIEVEKYCYMWREGGQFSTSRYRSKWYFTFKY